MTAKKFTKTGGGGFFWLARIYTPGFRRTRDNAEIDTADDYDDAHAFDVGLAEDFDTVYDDESDDNAGMNMIKELLQKQSIYVI